MPWLRQSVRRYTGPGEWRAKAYTGAASMSVGGWGPCAETGLGHISTAVSHKTVQIGLMTARGILFGDVGAGF